MNLGTSILLSALIVSITLLYINTKDAWNWKALARFFTWKTAKWTAVSVVGISVVFFILILSLYYFANRPYKMTEYLGIKLGADRETVRLIKGNPIGTFGSGFWSYKEFCVNFSEDNKVISITSFGNPFYYSREDVLNKYGTPVVVDTGMPDINSKSLFDRLPSFEHWKYPEYNVELFFNEDNKIQNFGIYDPTYKKPDFDAAVPVKERK